MSSLWMSQHPLPKKARTKVRTSQHRMPRLTGRGSPPALADVCGRYVDASLIPAGRSQSGNTALPAQRSTRLMGEARWTPQRLLSRWTTSVASICSFRFASRDLILSIISRFTLNPLQPLDNAANLWYYYDCFQGSRVGTE
jgi:hypothetical protein